MTRTEICNYYLERSTKVNDAGCLKILPEIKFSKNGVPTTTFNGENYLIARLIALEKFGDVTMKGMVTRHKKFCNNTWCINPDHITYGTQKENMQDKVKAGRAYTGNQKGEKPNRKLTEYKVKVIKKLLEQNITEKKIGYLFGVGKTCINSIKTGKAWDYVEPFPKTTPGSMSEYEAFLGILIPPTSQ